jgi:hypothetical protein
MGGAALALAAACCVASAGAVSARCEAVSWHHRLLDDPPAQSCSDSSAGNAGNDDDFSRLTLYAVKGRAKVPQPAMLLISGLGLLSVGLARRKKAWIRR